jgi:hypothetical protein
VRWGEAFRSRRALLQKHAKRFYLGAVGGATIERDGAADRLQGDLDLADQLGQRVRDTASEIESFGQLGEIIVRVVRR